MLTKLYIAQLLLISTILTSCGLSKKEVEINPEKITYESFAIEAVTNVNGELQIESSFPDNAIHILYHLKVVNKIGEPVEGMSVVYNQENGKSIVFVKDNLKRYNSVFLYGTPDEFHDIFSEKFIDENPPLEEQDNNGILKVDVALSVIPLNEAEVVGIQDAYRIETYHLTNSQEEGNDYLINCKEIEKVPEIIKDQTDNRLNSAAILISIVSPGFHELIEISSDKILDQSFNFSEQLILKVTDQWGMRTDEMIGNLIALKSYFPMQSDHLSNINTLFEYYEIELENTRCKKYIVNVPEEVNEFLNLDFIEILEGKGLEIHSGLVPPNVTGNYFVDNWTNLESGTRYVNYSFQFVNQTAEFQIEVRSAAEFSDATGIVAYISGEGPAFSIYSEQDHNINDGGHVVIIKTADIYSGEITSSGILNFQNGFIILDKQNDLNDRFLQVGDSRVVYEADFIADAVGSFPYNSIDMDPDNSFRQNIAEAN